MQTAAHQSLGGLPCQERLRNLPHPLRGRRLCRLGFRTPGLPAAARLCVRRFRIRQVVSRLQRALLPEQFDRRGRGWPSLRDSDARQQRAVGLGTGQHGRPIGLSLQVVAGSPRRLFLRQGRHWQAGSEDCGHVRRICSLFPPFIMRRVEMRIHSPG